MPPDDRPPLVGGYSLLEDFQSLAATVRVIRMDAESEEVKPHFHQRSSQVYVAVEGRVAVVVDGVETILTPYHALSVPRGAVHGIRPRDGAAIVLNLSVPPLAPNDQLAVASDRRPPDTDLPLAGSDLDD